MHITNLKKFIIVFINLATLTIQGASGFLYLAPPGAEEVYLFQDIAERDIYEIEIDLTLGDVELVGLSILEIMDTYTDRKLFLSCEPKTKEQALIAMQLGFITPRTNKELEKVRHIGFNNSVSLEQIVTLAGKELDPKSAESKTSQRFTQESKVHTLKFLKQKKVKLGTYICEEIELVTSDNYSTNAVANGMLKGNIQQFREGIKNACVLDFFMVVMDDEHRRTLVSNLSGEEDERENLASCFATVEENYANTIAYEKAKFGEEQIRHVREFLEGDHNFLTASIKGLDEKGLLEYISSAQGYIVFCNEAIRNPVLKNKKDEMFFTQKKKEIAEQCITNAGIALAFWRFEHDNIDGAEEALEEYCLGDHQNKTHLLEKIQQVRKQQEGAKESMRAELLAREIEQLIYKKDYDTAWTQAEHGKETFPAQKDIFITFQETIKQEAHKNINYWLPREERKKLVSYGERISELASQKQLSSTVGLAFMAQKDASLTIKVIGIAKKQKKIMTAKIQIAKELIQAILKLDSSVWQAIDEQARTFQSSLLHSTYWPKFRDDLKKLIPYLEQYENPRAFDATMNIIAGYIDAIDYLYYPQNGIIYNAIAVLQRETEAEPGVDIVFEGQDEETDTFVAAVHNFKQKHMELTLKGKNADKEAKEFINLLLSPSYKEIFTKVKLVCLKQDIKTDLEFLKAVLQRRIIDLDDYIIVLTIREITETILNVWKEARDDKKYTTHIPWADMTAWDVNAPEQEIPEEVPLRKALWFKLSETVMDIIKKADKNINFNRFPITIDDNGRIAEPSLLVTLPAIGFTPYISLKGLYDLLNDPESYTSVEVLPPDEDHPPELVIHLNDAESYVFVDNHLGYDAPKSEKSTLRIVLINNNLVETNIQSYNDLKENDRLKCDEYGMPLLVHRLKNKEACIAMQHYFVDYQRFYDVFIACAGKGGLMHKCAEKLRKVKRGRLVEILKVTEVMLGPKERLIIAIALARAAHIRSAQSSQALRVVQQALKDFPENRALVREKERLLKQMERGALIKRAEDAIDRGSLKSMQKAQNALVLFYLEPDQEVNRENMLKATGEDSEAFLTWWNLQRAIEDEQERLNQIRQHFIFAADLVEDKNFELARAEVDAAGALGADFRSRMAVLNRIDKEQKEYVTYLSYKKDLRFINKEIQRLNDVEDLNDINMALKKLKESFSHVPQYESKLNDESRTIQDKVNEKIRAQTAKVAQNSKDIERQIQEIQTTINQEEDINKLLTAKEKISQITKVLSPELIPSQLARDRFFTIGRKLGRELYQKMRVVVLKNKENFRVGLIDLRTDINKAETIEQLRELEKNFEDLRKNFEAIRQEIDIAKFQEIFKEIKLKLDMRIKITNLRIEKDQRELKAILKKISVNDEEIFKDLQARKRLLEGKIKALVALKERIEILPSQKVEEELIGKVDKVLQAKSELLGKMKYKANQLKLIEDIKTEIKHENLTEGILEWPLFGKNGLITQNIKPEQLAQRVYKLIDKLDLAIEESKNFYDNIDAQMKEVVKLKNDEIEQAKAELKEKPEKPVLKEAFVPGKKSLSKFDQEFIVLVVKGILDVRVKKLAKNLLSSRLTRDEHGVDVLFNKIVNNYLVKDIMLPGLQKVYNIMIHLKNDAFLEMKELCELIQGKHPDINQAMKALLIARFKKDARAESNAVDRLKDLLKKHKELKIPESNNYQAFLSWHPESDISKIVEALKSKLTPEISEKSTRFIDTAQ